LIKIYHSRINKVESTESQWSWNFSCSPDRRMNKRQKSITVHQQRKKQPQWIKFF